MEVERCTRFDAVIVGSGIAGALIALRLTQAGKCVLILEAGREAPDSTDAYMQRFYNAIFKVPESPYPPELFRTRVELHDPTTVNAGRPTVMSLTPQRWKDPTQSYLVQEGPLAFGSTYERVSGGTSQHWLGTCLRLLPSDFQMSKFSAASGVQFPDWPISYETLARPQSNGTPSWYSQAEWEIGVAGDRADQTYLGVDFFSEDYPMPAIPKSRVDERLEDIIGGVRLEGLPNDVQLCVRSTPAARNSKPYQSRRVCAGNTNCIPICPIQAKYDPSVTLNEAARTGKLEIWYRTVATEVVADGPKRPVREIRYRRYEQDRGGTSTAGSITAKVFIIAANAIETPRLLLMSLIPSNRRSVNCPFSVFVWEIKF